STGTASSTVDHVRALETTVESEREARRKRLAAIGAVAADFVVACASEDARAAVDAAARANAQLAALGDLIGLPIVTPPVPADAQVGAHPGGAAQACRGARAR